MSHAKDLDNSKACVRYLSRMLDVRVSELKMANHKMALLLRQTPNINKDEANSTKNTAESALSKKSISDSSTSSTLEGRFLSELVASKEIDLLESERKLEDALVCIADLKAQVQLGISLTKEKDETIENLEDLVMLHQSELSEIESLKSKNLELVSRLDSTEKLNETLVLELTSLRECVQLKEESIAQALIEKDDLQETSSCYKQLNSAMSQELTQLEAKLTEEYQSRQQAEDDMKALQLEKAQLVEQIEILGGELALYQQGGIVSLCSQTTGVSNSQQNSQTTAARFEATALQAEKEDLEQQLEKCKKELVAVRNNCSCHSNGVQHVPCDNAEHSQMVSNLRKMLAKVSAENSRISKALGDKSAELSRLDVELQKLKTLLIAQENQNMELVSQLLVLEDRVAESEVLCRDSQDKTERMAATAVKNTDSSIQLQERVNSLMSCMETQANELSCCQAELDLLKCKYKTVSERYQQLSACKNQLELSNRQLVEELSRYRDRQPAAEICAKCVEMEKAKSDSMLLRASHDNLRCDLDSTPASSHSRTVSIMSFPNGNTFGTSHEVVFEGSPTKRRCRTTSQRTTVSSVGSLASRLQNRPVKGTLAFHSSVVNKLSSGSVNVPNNGSSESWGSNPECYDASMQDLNLIFNDEVADDFEAVGSSNSSRRLVSSHTSEMPIQLSNRQLFSTTSADLIPPASQQSSVQSPNQSMFSNSLTVSSPVVQCGKRVRGRASLSLAHRSPKSVS